MTLSITKTKPQSRHRFTADAALGITARVWFGVAVAGQLIFAAEVASFYGRAILGGNLLALNAAMTHGFIAAEPIGNIVVGVHLAMAVLITLAGALQLIPKIRLRAPALHRWNGRFYVFAAFTISFAGLYMVWFRGTIGDLAQRVGVSLNALLIMLCAVMALRYALARDFATHRRWALRLFIVVSGVWFVRIGAVLAFLLLNVMGYNPTAFNDGIFTVMSYASYLIPLAVLELYLRAGDQPGTRRRVAMASALAALTSVMGVAIVAATFALWLPNLEAAYAPRATLDETLSATIRSRGVTAAVAQYRTLKAEIPARYDFDVDQLNVLGYELLRAGRLNEAVRILQLNVQSYPASANTYDSLGEADMDDGKKASAIINYRKSLALDPQNRNAAAKLRALDAGP
jgi:tetratricopeptide (TPR) repeat protein